MKVYITKYALTKGILEREVVLSQISPSMVSVTGRRYLEHYHKPHWHENKEDAIAQAEKMKENKLKSLKKQIQKLEKLSFNP